MTRKSKPDASFRTADDPAAGVPSGTTADITNILVVDDLPEKLLAYRAILEDLGQNLVTCTSGDEALKWLLRQEFAVVLLDVEMPILSGLDTAQIIRRRKKTALTPIIFLTAFMDEVRVVEGYAQGAVDYIQTPVIPDILRAKVKVFVDLFRMTRQVRLQAEERIALTEERARRAAAEDANRRLAFLAEASRIISGSLDSKAIARSVARLIVPTLAELGGVTLSVEPGPTWQTKLVWVSDPDPDVHARWLSGDAEDAATLLEATGTCLASGRPVHLKDVDLPFPQDVAGPTPSFNRIREVAIFPMLARGRTLGVLTLAFGSPERIDSANLATAADIASRAAVAFDNARLYHEIQLADQRKNEFLATLAHELRNPLAPIRNGLSILKFVGEKTGPAAQTRDMIDRQVTHLVRLIDDLLDVARITRGRLDLKRERTDFRVPLEAALEASRPHLEAAGHSLTVDVTANPLPVFGDVTRLAQVFSNLLNNAAKYTPDGGQIRVEVGARDGLVVAKVRDSGIGISPQNLAEVFDLFHQVGTSIDRAQGGLGIGLTLTRRIVELHGGRVEVESPGLNGGSTFTVHLPLAS